MAQTRKKTKTPVKKNTKSPAKKKSKNPAKKTTNSPAKKKAPATGRKRSKSPVGKKVIGPTNKKTKRRVSKETAIRNKKIKSALKEPPITEAMTPVPQVIKPDEVVHPIPVYNEMLQPMIEEKKKFERQLHSRDDIAMNQENQKVKSAMAKRQSMKRIFHTPR